MKPAAIVYTSKAGHTRQYALLLGERLGLSVHALDEACARLPDGSPVLYLGWLRASHVQGYRMAAKRFALCAVCGVGLCDTGALAAEVRKATGIPDSIPLFTLQGGIDRSGLKGIDRLMIALLSRALAAQKQRTAQDERMLALLSRDASYVCMENLAGVLRWYKEQ